MDLRHAETAATKSADRVENLPVLRLCTSVLGRKPATLPRLSAAPSKGERNWSGGWRTEGDSNPRNGFTLLTRGILDTKVSLKTMRDEIQYKILISDLI